MKTILLFLSLLSLSPLLYGASAVNTQVNGDLGGVQATDWTAYTPTLTGFGTASSVAMEWRRVGDSLEIRGSFVSGTPTATKAEMTLPTGLTTDTLSTYPLNVGTTTQDRGYSGSGVALIGSGVTYLTFGFQNSSYGGLTEVNGNDFITSGTKISISATGIPISGWTSTSPAGSTQSVSSGGSNYRMDGATIANSGSPSITHQSGSWISSVALNGTGRVDITVAGGEFSSTPDCVCSRTDTATGECAVNPTSTIAISVYMASSSGTATNLPFSIHCFGPH